MSQLSPFPFHKFDDSSGNEVVGDPSIPGFPIRRLLEAFDKGATVRDTWFVASETAGEPPKAHIVQILDIDVRDPDPAEKRLASTVRVVACSCEDYNYNKIPRVEDVNDPPKAFGDLKTCKHGTAVLETSRKGREREDGQSGFESYSETGQPDEPEPEDQE